MNNFIQHNWFKLCIVLLLLGALHVFNQWASTTNVQTEPDTDRPTEVGQTIEPPRADVALRASFNESLQHSAMADIAELACFPTARFDCTADSCTANAPGTYYFVDYGTESGTYFRCDKKGCDSYPVKVSSSGIYTQFSPTQGQAMLFKAVTDNTLGNRGEFVDVATIGTGAIISYGKCE